MMGVGGIAFFLGCILASTNPSHQTIVDTQMLVAEESQRQMFMIVYEQPKSEYQPIEFSYEDAQLLLRIAQAEAGNQGVEGMKLVMAVVLNRVANPDFPDTIEDVIFQPHQFQPVSDGAFDDAKISAEAHLALAEIESGKPYDEQIIGFEITGNNTLDRYFKYTYTVGGHDFYVQKGD